MGLFLLASLLASFADVPQFVKVREEAHSKVSECRVTLSLIDRALNLRENYRYQPRDLYLLYSLKGLYEFRLMKYEVSSNSYWNALQVVESAEDPKQFQQYAIEAWLQAARGRLTQGKTDDIISSLEQLSCKYPEIHGEQFKWLLTEYFELQLQCACKKRDTQRIEVLVSKLFQAGIEVDEEHCLQRINAISNAVYYSTLQGVSIEGVNENLMRDTLTLARNQCGPSSAAYAKLTISNSLFLSRDGNEQQRELCLRYIEKLVEKGKTPHEIHHVAFEVYDRGISSLIHMYDRMNDPIKAGAWSKERIDFCKNRFGVDSIEYSRAQENDFKPTAPK